jgi:hypothetical protein
LSAGGGPSQKVSRKCKKINKKMGVRVGYCHMVSFADR